MAQIGIDVEYKNLETKEFFEQLMAEERKEEQRDLQRTRRMLVLVKSGLWFPE